QAPAAILHGDTQQVIGTQLISDVTRQSTGFRPEQEGIPFSVLHLMIETAAFGGEPEQAACRVAGAKFVKAGVTLHRGELMIVQTRSAQTFVLPDKPQRFNQVKLKAGIGAKSDDVAGVRGDFGLVKDDMQHGWLADSWGCCERGSFFPLPRRERG